MSACPLDKIKAFIAWAPANQDKILPMIKHMLGKVVGTLSKSATTQLMKKGEPGVTSKFFFGDESSEVVDWSDVKDTSLDWEGTAERGAAIQCLKSYQSIVAMMKVTATDTLGLASALEDGCGAVGGGQVRCGKSRSYELGRRVRGVRISCSDAIFQDVSSQPRWSPF